MSDPESHFTEVSRKARSEMAAGFAAIVDVRTDEEWNAGHIPGAIHHELSRFEAGEFPRIEKDRKVYVHCAAGGRAARATDMMRENGWTDVTNMGGLGDWENAGGLVER